MMPAKGAPFWYQVCLRDPRICHTAPSDAIGPDSRAARNVTFAQRFAGAGVRA
jgi:hypothetical protein